MSRFMGWSKVADLDGKTLIEIIVQGTVTDDQARQTEESTEVKCSEFDAGIVEKMKELTP